MSIPTRVLVFDDQQRWLDLIKDTLSPVADIYTAIDPDNWNRQISAPYWDAIVVDVQILGSEESGVEIAEKSIYDFGVTSPIIIISGIVNLAELEQIYGDIFYGYVSKDNFSEILPGLVQKATTDVEKQKHLWKMLTAIAKRHGLLKKILNDEVVSYWAGVCPSIGNEKGRTAEDIINGTGTHLGQNTIDEIGKAILGIFLHEMES